MRAISINEAFEKRDKESSRKTLLFPKILEIYTLNQFYEYLFENKSIPLLDNIMDVIRRDEPDLYKHISKLKLKELTLTELKKVSRSWEGQIWTDDASPIYFDLDYDSEEGIKENPQPFISKFIQTLENHIEENFSSEDHLYTVFTVQLELFSKIPLSFKPFRGVHSGYLQSISLNDLCNWYAPKHVANSHESEKNEILLRFMEEYHPNVIKTIREKWLKKINPLVKLLNDYQ